MSLHCRKAGIAHAADHAVALLTALLWCFGWWSHGVLSSQLEHPARLNKSVKLIGLPKKDEKIPAGINCVVAGWGFTGANKEASKVLKEATEQTMSSTKCKYSWQQYFHGTRMICTKFEKKKGGFCQVHHIVEQQT